MERKQLNTFLKEAKFQFVYSKLKRVEFRKSGSSYKEKTVPVGSKVIGAVATRTLTGGVTISTLTDFDRKWLSGDGIDVSNVFRVNTQMISSVVKLNLESGTIAWFDNEYYMNTDKAKFSKAVPYTTVWVDYEMGEEFGIDQAA